MGHAGQPVTVTAQPTRVEFRVVELMNRLLDVTPDTIDTEIDAVLAAIGQSYGFDRTFLFSYAPETGYSNTNEWVAPGIKPLKPLMQGEPDVVRPDWHRSFIEGKIVAVHDRSALPSGSPERLFLTRIGVHSTLMVPLATETDCLASSASTAGDVTGNGRRTWCSC
jgi:GAF domain-containing protein